MNFYSSNAGKVCTLPAMWWNIALEAGIALIIITPIILLLHETFKDFSTSRTGIQRFICTSSQSFFPTGFT
ncbi:MAG: hypothetical protein OQJ78_07195 [Ignavibacteriaceae bacterium]|nr:hypothetical protein [Ignavibacteriaceae bacterium]